MSLIRWILQVFYFNASYSHLEGCTRYYWVPSNLLTIYHIDQYSNGILHVRLHFLYSHGYYLYLCFGLDEDLGLAFFYSLSFSRPWHLWKHTPNVKIHLYAYVDVIHFLFLCGHDVHFRLCIYIKRMYIVLGIMFHLFEHGILSGMIL